MGSNTPSKPAVVDIWAYQATGSPDIATPSYIDTGWPLISGVPVIPPRGYFNWLFNYLMNAVRYYCIAGFPAWDSGEAMYAAGAAVKSTDGNYYILLGTATTGMAPQGDTANWFMIQWQNRPAKSAWALATAVWQSAVGQRRRVITHPGFLEGKVLRWQESWDATAAIKTALNGGAAWFGKWNYSIAGDAAGGTITPSMPNAGPPTFSAGSNVNARVRGIYLVTNSVGTTDSSQEVEAPGQLILDADTCVAMQWDAIMLGGSGATAAEDTAGIVTTSLLGANGTTLSNSPFGAWFDLTLNPSGPTNLVCRWNGATGGLQVFNTFISTVGNHRHRFRIEIYGANTSDDGSPRVLFYLDGALLTNQIVDFTNATGTAVSAVATPFFRHDATAGSTWHHVETVDFNANTWAGDVAL